MFELKAILGYLYGQTRVKVGAEDGNGYFYCGTAEHLLAHLDEYSAEMEAYFRNLRDTAQEELEDLKNRPPKEPTDWRALKQKSAGKVIAEIIKRAHEGEQTGQDRLILKYLAEVGRYTTKMQQVHEKLARAQKLAEDFVPLGERHVAERFQADSVAEPLPVTVLKVRGVEGGKYWTVDEAKDKPFALTGVLGRTKEDFFDE